MMYVSYINIAMITNSLTQNNYMCFIIVILGVGEKNDVLNT